MTTRLNPSSSPPRRSQNPKWERLQELMEAYYADRSAINRDALFAAMHKEVPHLAYVIARKRTPQGIGAAAGPTAISDEVVARFWAKRSPTRLAQQYDPARSSFYTWISSVLNNEFLDWLDHNRRRVGDVDGAASGEPEPVEDGWHAWRRAPGPETRVNESQQVLRTRQALAGLPAELRQVALLRGEGLTLEEIAEREGISLATVKRRQKEAFDRLRAALGNINS